MCALMLFTSFGNISLKIALPHSLYLFYCWDSFYIYVYTAISSSCSSFSRFSYTFNHRDFKVYANSQTGSSVNLFHLLIFSKFSCIFTCKIISGCTDSIVCTQTVDALVMFPI